MPRGVIARAVPHLSAETLHGLVQSRGVEDCLELLVAATPAQLESILDLDLWRPVEAGLDEQFDVARFGEWVEALVEGGAPLAATILSRMNTGLVVAGLSAYIRVFDRASLASPWSTRDDERGGGRASWTGLSIELGHYVVHARATHAWDAIVALLLALETDHRDGFHAVMRGCRRLSDSARETDGLDDLLGEADQLLRDIGDARDVRRAAQGFLTPADARVFLRMSREPRDSSPNPIAVAYARAQRQVPAPTGRARPLLSGQVSGGLPNDAPHAAADLERAFLVNALVAGCTIQARTISAQEANEVVTATCQLGNELLSDHRSPDLVLPFQAGWAALHEASLLVGRRLVDVLAHVRTLDSMTHQGLVALRHELDRCCRAGAPWGARDALDVLAILDPVGWTGVLGVLDECPVVTDALTAVVERRRGAVSASAFTFVSSVRQLSAIRAFAGRLHDIFPGPS